MKYGYLSFGRNPAQGRVQYGNLGDWYQSFAVRELFRKMGIPDPDVQTVDRTGITAYRGERTRLVLQGCFLHMKGAPVFPVSADIDPCFFGFHCLSVLDRRGIASLPDDLLIGCRDEATFRRPRRRAARSFWSTRRAGSRTICPRRCANGSSTSRSPSASRTNGATAKRTKSSAEKRRRRSKNTATRLRSS